MKAKNDGVFQQKIYALLFVDFRDISDEIYEPHCRSFQHYKILSNDINGVKFYLCNLLNIFINYLRNVMHQEINNQYY